MKKLQQSFAEICGCKLTARSLKRKQVQQLSTENLATSNLLQCAAKIHERFIGANQQRSHDSAKKANLFETSQSVIWGRILRKL